MADITRKFTGASAKLTPDGWQYTEAFIVTGVPDKLSAGLAVLAAYPVHPDDPRMVANDPSVSPLGLLVFEVDVPYTLRGRLSQDDPLSLPTEFKGDFETVTVQLDRDQDGNKILNSAGDPFDPSPTDTAVVFVLICERNIPSFSIAMGYNFTDAVNSNTFSLPGLGGVGARSALCRYYKPISTWRFGDTFVRVQAAIAFRAGQNPWDYHPTDQGRMGWYSSSGNKRGAIIAKNGNEPGFDVRLDGTGKPLASDWQIRNGPNIGDAPVSPVANPTLPPGLVVDTTRSTTDNKVLEWKTKFSADFSALPF